MSVLQVTVAAFGVMKQYNEQKQKTKTHDNI